MIPGKELPFPYKKIWVSAYVHETIECIEIRTVDQNNEDDYHPLWHHESGTGNTLADLLYVDLSLMDDDLVRISNCIQKISVNEEVEKSFDQLFFITRVWLGYGAVFAPFAVQIQRLHLDWKAKNELSMRPLQAIANEYKILQKRFSQIADECLNTVKQESMVDRYMMLRQKAPEIYKLPSYGRISLEVVSAGVKRPYDYDDTLAWSTREITDGDYINAEVLSTECLDDLVHFLLSRYLLQNVRYRTCKFCGKYFGITGNYKGDYCDRMIDGSLKTCKEGGSLRLYEMRKLEEPAIREYKRSYKAHNARIRYKAMTREEFNAWSIEARKRRDQCLAGEISLQEFVAWLDSDKR